MGALQSPFLLPRASLELLTNWTVASAHWPRVLRLTHMYNHTMQTASKFYIALLANAGTKKIHPLLMSYDRNQKKSRHCFHKLGGNHEKEIAWINFLLPLWPLLSTNLFAEVEVFLLTVSFDLWLPWEASVYHIQAQPIQALSLCRIVRVWIPWRIRSDNPCFCRD